MTRTQAIDSAVKYAIRKHGYSTARLRREMGPDGLLPWPFINAVLTAWDKINPSPSTERRTET